MDKNEKDIRFPMNLFCSLMLLSFIPFIYTLVRTYLIANVPLTDGLGIAGHMEWFDLLNETINAERSICAQYNIYLYDVWIWYGNAFGVQYYMLQEIMQKGRMAEKICAQL